jgi:hypothetical protein
LAGQEFVDFSGIFALLDIIGKVCHLLPQFCLPTSSQLLQKIVALFFMFFSTFLLQ